jgi:hypothetical protein
VLQWGKRFKKKKTPDGTDIIKYSPSVRMAFGKAFPHPGKIFSRERHPRKLFP